MGRVRAPAELEEVPMPIVGGLDIHRKQLTFDYLCDTRSHAVSERVEEVSDADDVTPASAEARPRPDMRRWVLLGGV